MLRNDKVFGVDGLTQHKRIVIGGVVEVENLSSPDSVERCVGGNRGFSCYLTRRGSRSPTEERVAVASRGSRWRNRADSRSFVSVGREDGAIGPCSSIAVENHGVVARRCNDWGIVRSRNRDGDVAVYA